MGRFRIGRHINISKGFLTAPKYASSIGCEIMQIFLGAPTQVVSKPKDQKELRKFGVELKKYKLKMVIHGSYTINLCQPSSSKLFKSSVRSLVQDLNASNEIGKRCLGVIIHMGKNVITNGLSIEQALTNYISGLKKALADTPENTTIVLETGASQGKEVASKIDGLSEIYWSLDENERSRVKFCVDTCHIWNTGYDISTSAGVDRFFKEFDRKIGIENIVCIHFNDSKTPLDSKVDRHADLGYGFIGSKGLKSFGIYAKKKRIPIIMETPLDAVNPKTNQDVTFLEEFEKLKAWLGI